MSGNVVVDRSKEVAFPRSYQPSQGIPADTDGNEDLYTKLKALEKQLEFLEIQVSFLFFTCWTQSTCRALLVAWRIRSSIIM